MSARPENPFAPPATSSVPDEAPSGSRVIAEDRVLAIYLDGWQKSRNSLAIALAAVAAWTALMAALFIALLIFEPIEGALATPIFAGVAGLFGAACSCSVLGICAWTTRDRDRTSGVVLAGCYATSIPIAGGAAAWGVAAYVAAGPWRDGLGMTFFFFPVAIFLAYGLFVGHSRDAFRQALSRANIPLDATALKNGTIYVRS